jgi:hypothetical protein
MKKKKEVLRVVPCAGAALDPPLWTIRFLLIKLSLSLCHSLSLSLSLSLPGCFYFFPNIKNFRRPFLLHKGGFYPLAIERQCQLNGLLNKCRSTSKISHELHRD